MWSTVHLPLRHSASSTLGSFSKPRRWRWQERHQTKGLMSRTTAVHVRFESWYISLPSSAKQQCEMTKCYVFWRTRTTMANFWYLLLELNAVGACLAWANVQTDRCTEQIYSIMTFEGKIYISFFTRHPLAVAVVIANKNSLIMEPLNLQE